MTALAASGMAEWKLILLIAMTFIAIGAAHVHSARRAFADVRGRPDRPRWRTALAYLGRHEVYYAKQIPLLIFFVLCSVAVVASI
jgi:hypothetical protein